MNIRFKHAILTVFVAAAVATTSVSFAKGGSQGGGYKQSGGYGGYSSQRGSEQGGYGQGQGRGNYGQATGGQSSGQGNGEGAQGNREQNKHTYQHQYRYERKGM